MLRHNLSIAAIAIFFLANYQIVPVMAQIQCLVCDSSQDANCITDLTKITPAECADTTNCFTKVDTTSGKVTRGCIKDADKPTCTEPDCLICPTATCNKHNICKSCDSSKDPTCSQTDSSVATFNSVCAAENTQCLVNVKTDKHIERHCATAEEVTACTNETTCKACTGPNCNTGIFPVNRIACYQCASTDTKCADVAANSGTIKSIPCLLYDDKDKCYSFGTGDTSMTRGCVSDPDTNVNKCSTPDANEQCLTCSSNNCNDPTYMVDQKLKCIQCTSSATDTKCSWGQSVNDAKNCANKIMYNKKEQCFVQTKDSVTHRGCLYDRDITALGECTTENNCTTCNGTDGCNNKANDFTCIVCRSDEEPKCRKEAATLPGSTCRNPVSEAESGCFSGIWNNIVIRGCLVDADERVHALCMDTKNDQCTNCKDSNCNTNKLPNGAATMTLTTGLLSILLLALWRLY